MSKLDDDLDTQSYEITDELKIRKKLEANTPWNMEFVKSGTYEYDLELWRWDDNPDSQSDRELMGYFELERARRDKKKSWVNGDIPEGWPILSCLQRKIYQWEPEVADHKNGELVGGYRRKKLKPKYRRAIFLKFNNVMDNCFAVPIATFVRDGFETKISDDTRTNSYIGLPKDHNEIAIGIESTVDLIQDFLANRQNGQSGLESFNESPR